MSKEVTKLKEALNSLSQLSYSASSSKRQSQQLDGLQQQVKQLQTQLAVSGLAPAWWGGERGGLHAYSAGWAGGHGQSPNLKERVLQGATHWRPLW